MTDAPVIPLFLFGRMQDFAYQQEVARDPAKRHHVRFWRTPEGWLLPGGTRVDWLAAGTFDRAVGFSLFTLQITHRIDADIDIERDFVVQSLLGSSPEVGVVHLPDFSTGYHSRNGGGDSVHTDGTAAPARHRRRPVAVTGGAILVWLRALGGLLWLAGFASTLPGFAQELDLTDEEQGAIFGIVVFFDLAWMAVLTLLGWLALCGNDAARLLIMMGTSLSITVAAIDYFTAGDEIAVRSTLLTLTLDILILLALSSRDARAWSRGRRRFSREADRELQS